MRSWVSLRLGLSSTLTPAYPRKCILRMSRLQSHTDLFQAQSFLDPSVLGTYPEELVEALSEHDLLPEYTTWKSWNSFCRTLLTPQGENYYQPFACHVAPRFATS